MRKKDLSGTAPLQSASKIFRKDRPCAARRGYTLIELLITVIVMSVIMLGLANLMNAHWQSYWDTINQNNVNQQARQALDAICDDVRLGGQVGFNSIGSLNGLPQVLSTASHFSDAHNIVVATPNLNGYLATYSRDGNNLTRNYGGNTNLIARNISDVEFQYEYRLPSDGTTWSFERVANPYANGVNPDVVNRINTVYVTVTAQYAQPGGTTYTRTLSSAVHLRAPYSTVPNAVQ